MEGAPERYEELRSVSGRSFEAFFRLYAESMPPRELKPREQIEAMVGRPDYEILLAKQGERVLGYGVSYLPTGEPCSLLEYLAVAGASRGTGVGGRLLRELRRRDRSRGAVWMLVEVESERDGDVEDGGLRRRQQFYRGHGCLRIEHLPYLLPLAGEGPPPAMDLLVQPPEPPELGAVLRKADLGRWLACVFVDAYACRPDDPRIAQMLANVGDPVRLV